MLTLVLALFTLSPAIADDSKPMPTLDQALERMAVELKDQCDFDDESVKERKGNSTTHAFTQKTEWAVNSYQLFEIPCSRGAYNFGSVYYLADNYGQLKRLTFAEPAMGEKGKVIGWETSEVLINSGFEPKDLTLSFFSKGRGIGDCFTSGTYKFVNGSFLLKTYDYDGTCDGKINPKRIVNLK